MTSDSSPRLVLGARRSRAGGAFLFLGLLTITAAAAGYVWINHERLAEATFSVTPPAAAPLVNYIEETVPLKDFQSFQRRATEDLKSATQEITALQAHLESLSDRVKSLSEQVSALAAGVDAVKREIATAPSQPAILERPPVIPVRKKAAALKTRGPISFGGAPLPPAPPHGHEDAGAAATDKEGDLNPAHP